jgi:hypothetical protein
MTKKEFLDIVAEAYPDTDIIQMYYDENGEYVAEEAGDTLAEFIIRECLDMFDELSEADTLESAAEAMDRAMDDVWRVAEALYNRLEEINGNARGSQGATGVPPRCPS